MSDKEKKSHKNSKKTDKKTEKKHKKNEKSAKQNALNSNAPLQRAPLTSPNSPTHANTATNPAPLYSSKSENLAKSKKTFWPYGILLSLFAIVCACVVTIVFASNYPVYEDDSFLGKYQEVDYHFNEIQQKDEKFKQNYKISLNAKPKFDEKKREFYELKAGTKELVFIVDEVKEGKNASDIKPTLLLTRPHTNAQDSWLHAGALTLANAPYVIRGQKSTARKKSFNRYTFKATLPELSKGRWQVKLKATKDENIIGFYEFNLVVAE